MKRHALLVGINHYQDDTINDLRGAEQDAVDLYGILRDRLDFDDARYLPSPDQQTVLNSVASLVSGLGAGDQFLFFFAGHGVLHDGKQQLLMPEVHYHRVRHAVGTVSVDALRDESGGRGINRLFILDCCRSNLHAGQRDALQTTFDGGVILRDLVARAPRPAASADEESLSILCSCEDGQQAAEIPGGQGLFTTALANRLRASGRQGARIDDAFVAALGQDMMQLATRHGLGLEQHPLWLPAGVAPVLSAPHMAEPDMDARLWDIARRQGSLEAYQAYLHLCEECSHRDRAEAAIRNIVGAASSATELRAERSRSQPIAAEAAPTKSAPVVLPRIELIHGWSEERVRGLQAQTAKALGKPVVYRDRLKDGSEGPELVVIPAGRFVIGSPKGEAERNNNEGPQHEIEIAKPFGLGRYAVTFEEYQAYCRLTGAKEPDDRRWGKGRRPVINVSWDDAQGYAKWLSEQTGRKYRLPTEAEWEYGCRAGTEGAFNFGGISAAKANYDVRHQYEGSPKGEWRERTVAVEAFEGNRWGLYQIHGNVWEWTCSAYDKKGYKQGKDGAHTQCGDTAPAGRALRGGSWLNVPWRLRSAYRGLRSADFRNNDVGFRLAQDL